MDEDVVMLQVNALKLAQAYLASDGCTISIEFKDLIIDKEYMQLFVNAVLKLEEQNKRSKRLRQTFKSVFSGG